MSKKDPNKLTINPWRIIKIFILAFFVFEIIFYLSIQGVKGKLFPPDNSFYYYTPGLLIASFIFCYISLTQTYYEINGASFIHSKMGKIDEYVFSNIIFIDEEFSERKKMMRFFTKDGKEHVLMFDKEGVIYKTSLKKCPLLSLEEFERRFPNIKM